jgi:hypothetical protein
VAPLAPTTGELLPYPPPGEGGLTCSLYSLGISLQSAGIPREYRELLFLWECSVFLEVSRKTLYVKSQ